MQVKLAQEGRKQAALHEEDAVRRLAIVWTRALESLTVEYANFVDSLGPEPTSAQLRRDQRYRDLIAHTERVVANFGGGVANSLPTEQNLIGLTGTAQASGQLQVTGMFDVVSVPAVNSLVVTLWDRHPIRELLIDAAGVEADDVLQAIVDGVATGRNPRQVASDMAATLDRNNYSRYETITRTEMLRAYRAGSQATYSQNGITQYRRLAAKSPRTCVACLALDGRVYETDDLMELHPNDRCTMVPIVPGAAPTSWLVGEEWFARQPPERQLQMLGQGRHDLYRAGKPLGEFVKITQNRDWGPTATVKSLKELQ